jgi:hypothetical protein
MQAPNDSPWQYLASAMSVFSKDTNAKPTDAVRDEVKVTDQAEAHNAIKEYLMKNVEEFLRLEELRAIVSHHAEIPTRKRLNSTGLGKSRGG